MGYLNWQMFWFGLAGNGGRHLFRGHFQFIHHGAAKWLAPLAKLQFLLQQSLQHSQFRDLGMNLLESHFNNRGNMAALRG